MAVIALAQYDAFTNSTTPDLLLDVRNGDSLLVDDFAFDGAGDRLTRSFAQFADAAQPAEGAVANQVV